MKKLDKEWKTVIRKKNRDKFSRTCSLSERKKIFKFSPSTTGQIDFTILKLQIAHHRIRREISNILDVKILKNRFWNIQNELQLYFFYTSFILRLLWHFYQSSKKCATLSSLTLLMTLPSKGERQPTPQTNRHPYHWHLFYATFTNSVKLSYMMNYKII